MKKPFSSWKSRFGKGKGKKQRKQAAKHSKNRSLQIENLEPRQMLATDIAAMPFHQMIDNQDVGYVEQGLNWQTYIDSAATNGSYRYHAAGSALDGNVAQWSFEDLDPTKSYQVFASWTPGSNRASNVGYRIGDDSSELTTVRVNQQAVPNDATDGSKNYESLGVYQADSGHLIVQLGDDANSFVIADSVCIAEVPTSTALTPVVDDGDSAYSEQGNNWLGYNDSASSEGDFRYHTPGTGENTASFTISNLDPTKNYQLFATWSAASNRASNAGFSVLNGDSTLATVRLNQRFAPDDQIMDGRGWESLGTFQFSSATAVVKLSDNADGFVIADSIRAVEVPPTTVVTTQVDEGDASYAEQGSNWLGSNDSASNNGDFRYHVPGTGENTATFTLSNLDPTKQYQVFATWSAASNRGSNVAFSILDNAATLNTIRLNQRFAPDDQTIDGRGWESLGVYQIQSGTLVVRLSDNADGLVIADSIRIVEVPPTVVVQAIVDEGDASYAEQGSNWLGYNDSSANNHDYRYHVPGTGQNTATFTVSNLDPTKRYQVFATWSAASNRGSNVPFRVADGSTVVTTVQLNQRFAPDDQTIGGRGWESIGVYQFQSGTLVVQLSDNADGLVIADAIRVVEVPPVTVAPEVVDEGDSAYAEVGNNWWRGYNDAASYLGDFRYHPSGTGADAATWTFDALDPTKQYRVLATWSAASNRASNAAFSISENAATLATIRLNQRFAPDDATIDGRAWENLGVYQFASGRLIVKLTDDADGLVVADAIRLVEVEPSTITPTLIDEGDIGYHETGSNWLGYNDSASLYGDFRYHAAGTGENQATWSFDNLPDGQYQIFTTWSAASNRAGNAPYRIASNEGTLGDVRVNQRVAPAEVTIDGKAYKSLGSYFVYGGKLTVSLSDDANGLVIADAVRLSLIEYAPHATTITPIEVVQGTSEVTVDLSTLFADQDDPTSALTFSVVGNTNAVMIASASVEGQTLRFTIGSRQFGAGELRIRATDPAGAYTEAALPINVNLAAGLYTRFYSGAWSNLPDFTVLTPLQIGTSAAIDLSQFAQQEYYAVQFSGKIAIPTTGDYTFYTTSDDGSRLWIDGQMVVDNDGLHGAQEQSGTITLSAGMHTIRVDFVQGSGDQSLSAAWAGPGFTKEAIPTSVLLHESTNTPPSTPANFTAIPAATAINVAWVASESDVGVANYELYRNGILLTTTTRTFFRDTTTTSDPSTTFSYSVIAVDVLGNRSLVTPEAVSGPVLELASGLVARSYRGSWAILPELDAIPAEQATVVTDFSLSVAPSSDFYAIDFHGQIEVTTSGVYTFITASDDGSRLWIDGQLVVNNDGIHPAWDRSGSILLTAGMHDIRVGYFQSSGGQALSVQWEGPDMARQEISAAVLYHSDDTQAPQSPELLSVAPSVHFTALAWSTPLDNWVTTGYEILRDGQVIGTTTDHSFIDSTVTPGVSYEYGIVALDAAGNRSTAAVCSVATPDLPSGVFWRSFAGFQGQVPDFSQMLPVASGTAENFDLAVRPSESGYSLDFTSRIEVFTEGDYTFYTNSDDGSRLWIDGQLVVNNDGLHATEERSGQIHLTTGMHDLRVEFIQGDGGQLLECSWQGPGFAKELIPNSVLYVANDTQAPVAPEILAIDAARVVVLRWSQPQDNRMATAYEVLRDGQLIATVTDRRFVDSTVAPNTTYSYSIVALDAAGNRSVASDSASAVTMAAELPAGVYWRSFAGFQGQVPDFRQMLPLAVGTAANFSLDVRPSDSDYSLEFTGKIETLDEGDYTFYTNSDDGSRLWIDGLLVVNNDGLHGTVEVSGQIHLAFGIHDIRVEFIQAGGGQVLECSWQGPGFDKQLIPAASLMIGPDSQSPEAPQAPTAAAAIHTVTLTWPQPLDNRVVNSYEILRDGQMIGVTQQRSFVDAGLAPGGTYSYSIIALDAAGNRSVASEAAAVTTQSLPSGIVWRYFAGSWGSVPDFASLMPQIGGVGSEFGIGVRQSDVNYAIEFSGKLEILVEGDYTFFTTSDDASRLWIDGQCVVDNDGMHGSQERSGQIHLTAGLYDIRVGYVQGTGEQSLDVAWQGPGFARQAIAADQLYHVTESEAPTAVQNLAALSLAGSVCLTWTAATDNTAVAGYDVYRNGKFLGFTRYASFRDTTATHAGGDSYTVVTRDAFENLSPASAPVVSAPLLDLPSGVVYRVFSGVWQQVPDFANLAPQSVGTTTAIDFSARPADANYAIQFSGKLEIPVAGEYRFYLSSDDGSCLWIDGQLVVDNDGVHPYQDRSGAINLSPGMHTIELGYFQTAGEQSLSVAWEGPGFAKQPIGQNALYHERQAVGAYLAAPAVAMEGGMLNLDARAFDFGGGSPASVSFYRDANDNGIFDAADELLAIDADGSDGFSARVSTANWPLAVDAIFARFDFADGTSLVDSAVTTITAAAPVTLTWAGGDGVWDAASPLWLAADGTVQPWQDGADAVFTGAPGTITIRGTVCARSLTFQSGGYTLAGAMAADKLLIGDEGLTIDVQDRSVPVTVNTVITGGTAETRLLKIGQGALVLGAVNTLTCDTVIAGGVVRLGVDNALPATQSVQLGAPNYDSGILNLNGHNLTLVALTSGEPSETHRPIFDTATNTDAITSKLTVANSADVFYDGIFDGNLAIDKFGPGKWTVSGVNTNTSNVVVYDGTLSVTGCFTAAVATVPGFGNPVICGKVDPTYWFGSISERRGERAFGDYSGFLYVKQAVVDATDWKAAAAQAFGGTICVNDTYTHLAFPGPGFKIGTLKDLREDIGSTFDLNTSCEGIESDDTKLIVIEDLTDCGNGYTNDRDYDDAYWVLDVAELNIEMCIDANNDGRITDADELANHATEGSGKWIPLNDRDTDKDGIPGFADGFEDAAILNGQADCGSMDDLPYAEVTLTLPSDIDLGTTTVAFSGIVTSSSSTPVFDTSTGWVAPGGSTERTRLWRKGRVIPSGPQFVIGTNSWSVEQMLGSSYGLWIPGGKDIDAYSLGFSDTCRQVTFYAEGLHDSANLGDASISVNVKLGPSVSLTHTVKATVAGVNVKMGRSLSSVLSDQNEECILVAPNTDNISINNGDTDNDGILDYFDGFDGGLMGGGNQGASNPDNQGACASAKFSPLEVTISSTVDIAKATITFNYPDSNPRAISYDSQNNPIPHAWPLRIWTLDGDSPRRAESVIDEFQPGDFVIANTPIALSRLGFASDIRTRVLYVEGICNSSADTEIKAILNPEGSSSCSSKMADATKVTVGAYVYAGVITYKTTWGDAPVRYAKVELSGAVNQTTYTDKNGQFEFHFADAPPDPATSNCELSVYCESNPEVLSRSVKVLDGSWGGGEPWRIVLGAGAGLPVLPSALLPVVVGGYTIGDGVTDFPLDAKAFWVYDACVTGAIFRSALPSVTRGTDNFYFYEGVARTTTAPSGEYCSIADDVFQTSINDAYDDILHEYGHKVAIEEGFDNSRGGAHYPGVNCRTKWGPALALDLAFNEGWANFFSILVQEEAPCPSFTCVISDRAFLLNPVESVNGICVKGGGEDEELAVMRILWDLYDPKNEPHDQVELGMAGLFNLLRANGAKVTSLPELRDQVISGLGLDANAIFADNRCAVTLKGFLANGQLQLSVPDDVSSGVVLVFDSPIGSKGERDENLVLIPDCGELFDAFSFSFYDANDSIVYDGVNWLRTGLAPNDPTYMRYQIVIDAVTWQNIITNLRAVKWTVSARWAASDHAGDYESVPIIFK